MKNLIHKNHAQKLESEGFEFAGLFGCDFRATKKALNKALKPFGLQLQVRGCYRCFADQSFIKIMQLGGDTNTAIRSSSSRQTQSGG